MFNHIGIGFSIGTTYCCTFCIFSEAFGNLIRNRRNVDRCSKQCPSCVICLSSTVFVIASYLTITWTNSNLLKIVNILPDSVNSSTFVFAMSNCTQDGHCFEHRSTFLLFLICKNLSYYDKICLTNTVLIFPLILIAYFKYGILAPGQ
jgi:hypothetical protein